MQCSALDGVREDKDSKLVITSATEVCCICQLTPWCGCEDAYSYDCLLHLQFDVAVSFGSLLASRVVRRLVELGVNVVVSTERIGEELAEVCEWVQIVSRTAV